MEIFVEEYSPMLHKIKGPKNILADSLSRLHRLPSGDGLANATHLVPLSDTDSVGNIEGCFFDDSSKDLDPEFPELYQSCIQDATVKKILKCYVNFPDETLVQSNPLSFKYITNEQQTDENWKF